MYIEAEEIAWKNFLATGNQFIRVSLNKHQTTFISGTNGAGKTTFVDAIFFAWFGKAFRDINKPNLVNSKNRGHCLVEFKFKRGQVPFLIRRGLKPTVFEIYENGVLIDQDSTSKDYQKYLEDNILGMNEKTCRQMITIESRDFKPFMKLTAQERRDFIDRFLDLTIYPDMAKLNKGLLDRLKIDLESVEREIDTIQSKIDIHLSYSKASLEELKNKRSETLETIDNLTKSHEEKVAECQEAKEAYEKKLGPFLRKKAKLEELAKSLSKMDATVKTKLERLDEDLRFFRDHDQCPMCRQGIDETHKEMIETENALSREVLSGNASEIDKNLDTLASRLEKLRVEQDDLDKELEVLNNLQMQEHGSHFWRKGYIEDLADIDRRIADIEDSSTPSESIATLQKELDVAKVRRDTLINERRIAEIAAGLLKDGGVKSKYIKEYLPIINDKINEYLYQFALVVNFNIDENFNEVIKSRYRDQFQYGNFSNGEKQRIDLAFIFTWRDLAKIRSSTDCNLLILDETFDASLDGPATEELLRKIRFLDKKANVVVISHKTERLAEKMDRHLKFSKVNDFSRMTVVS
jgi:DNA repair exonuclease SbcCD ATPase subunit